MDRAALQYMLHTVIQAELKLVVIIKFIAGQYDLTIQPVSLNIAVA